MNIVVIDDEQDIGFIMSFELKLSGHEAFFFETAETTKEYIFNNITRIDAIICDFQMPRLNGLDIFRWVREQNYKGPFYILTGEPTMDTERLLKEGVTQVLFKPHDLNKLSEILKK